MSKDLGKSTSYAYYVAEGGTKTPQEYGEMLVNIDTVATRAEDAADSAAESATGALNSKNAAQTAATTATNKATEATTAATTATTKAAEASTSASTATSAKDTAVSASQTATTKATEATTAAATATSAKTDAVAANTAAQSAKTAAQTAQTGAETAAASVSASAAQIATNAEDISQLKSGLTTKADLDELYKAFPTDTASGAIASFSDGAELPIKSLTVDIEPIQDLHGYDNPWPAGGGKNKLPITVDGIKSLNPSTRGTWVGNSYTYLGITYTLVTDSDGNIIKIHVSGTKTGASYLDLARIKSIPYGTYILNGGGSGTSIRAYHFDGTNIAASTSAAGTQFTSTEDAGNNTFDLIVASDSEVNVDVYPMVRLTSETDATFVPYSNICPISGHTQAVVTRTGKNLFDKSAVLTGMWLSTTTGLEEANGSYCVSDYIPVKSGETVYIPGSGTARRWFYDRYKNPVTYLNNSSNQAFTPLADGYIRVTIAMSGSDAKDLNTYQIEYGSTATAFEPYSGQSINISLGQTVYGGTLDVVSGELVIDRELKTLNGTEPWGIMDGVVGCFDTTTIFSSQSGQAAICDIYRSVASYSALRNTNSSMFIGTTRLLIHDDRFTTVADFKSNLASNPTHFVMPFATPVTVQLTPHEVTALLGSNNVWADTGDSAVEYRADPTLYIQRLTEPDADMVADSNITSGQYFMVGNTLYKATANIASGATISPNVNCTRKSLSEALNELNA